MKTRKQIDAARAAMRRRMVTPGLTDIQKSMVMGVSCALQWVAGVGNRTVERLLSDEAMDAGKDVSRVMERMSSLPTVVEQQVEIEKLRDALSGAVVFIDQCKSTSPAMELCKQEVLVEAAALLLSADEKKKAKR